MTGRRRRKRSGWSWAEMTVVEAEARRCQNSEVDIEVERAMSTGQERAALRLGGSAGDTEMGPAEAGARGPGWMGRVLSYYFQLPLVDLGRDGNS